MSYGEFGVFTSSRATSVNAGLRSYMMRIYNYMSVALGLSGVVAYFTAKSGLAMAIFTSPLGILVALAPLFMSMYLGFKFHSMTFEKVRSLFFVYSGLMGVSLSSVFLVYTMSDVSLAFFVTASMFGSMSIYGYVTKKDLSAMGSFLIMCVFGLLIASLANMFVHSSGMSMAISFISVLVFAGLTAYDTQKMRDLYYQLGGSNLNVGKLSVFGAMQLYMDFVAIFVHLLHIIGAMKNDR
jgi:FtsH-binding integral membrane protein